MAAMVTVELPAGVRWRMEELKDLLRAKLDDHDLLIELRTLHRATDARVDRMMIDHENRLRVLERIIFYGLGATALGVFLFKVFGGKFGI